MKKKSIDEEYSQQLPEASPQDWKLLEGQLEVGEMKRRLRGVLWAFPLALVALTGFSGWQSYELVHTRKRLDVLERMAQTQASKGALDDRSDTLHQRVVVHDTVFLTTAVRYSQNRILPGNEPPPELTQKSDFKPENAEVVFSSKKTSPNALNSTLSESAQLVQRTSAMDSVQEYTIKGPRPDHGDATLRAIAEATADMPDAVDNPKAASVNDPKLPPEPVATPKVKEEKLALSETTNTLPKDVESVEQAKQNKTRKVAPLSIEAGVSAGLLSPIEEGIGEDSRGVMAGLRVQLKYSPRWSVVLEAQRNNLRFHQEGEHNFSFLPEVNPPTPEARLQEAEVYEYSSWQFGIGAQYIVFDRFRWKPYVRLGWAMQKPTHYLVEYKYIDANREQSEYYYTFRDLPSITNIAQGTAGVSCPLGERLTASGEITYQRQWKAIRQTPSLLNVKAAIVYRLSKKK